MQWLFRWFRKPKPSEPVATTGPRASAGPRGARPASPSPSREPAHFDVAEAYDYPPEERQLPSSTSLLVENLHDPLLSFLKAHEDELPAFPAVASQVIELISHANFEVQKLVNLIQRDSVMSAEVLRVSNSPMFGGMREISSVREAIVQLGANQVANIASAASARSLFDLEAKAGQQEFAESWNDQWLHSMTCATTSFWVSDQLRLENQRYGYLGGMLHDIGKTVALWALTKMVLAQRVPPPTPNVISATLEDVHVKAGRFVTSRWEIPQVLLQTVTSHHDIDDEQDPLIAAVALTSALNEIRRNPSYAPKHESDLRRAMTRLDVTPAQMRSFVTRLRESQQMAELLNRR